MKKMNKGDQVWIVGNNILHGAKAEIERVNPAGTYAVNLCENRGAYKAGDKLTLSGSDFSIRPLGSPPVYGAL